MIRLKGTLVDNDYQVFLEEMGLTQEMMDKAAATMPPPLVEEEATYYVAESNINNLGVFAGEDCRGIVALLKSPEGWYVAGRYANHSAEPSVIPVKLGDLLLAYGKLNKDQEITLDYRHVRSLLEH